jgi:hypothetical protein
MMESPLNISLTQGQTFMKFQNKIKKATLQHKRVKEGFETQQQNVISPVTNTNITVNSNNEVTKEDKQMIIKINKMEKKFNHLVTIYKQELQNIQNKVTKNSIDTSSSIVSNDDQLILDNIKNQLTILGNDISTTMEALYNKNNEIYKEMNMNSEQFKKNIQMYKDVNNRIENINKEGMSNMSPRDLNSLVSDSSIYVLYENYNYVLWSILAITTLSVTMKLLK